MKIGLSVALDELSPVASSKFMIINTRFLIKRQYLVYKSVLVDFRCDLCTG